MSYEGQIKTIEVVSNYKYLRNSEWDMVRYGKVKTLVCDEYKKRLRS